MDISQPVSVPRLATLFEDSTEAAFENWKSSSQQVVSSYDVTPQQKAILKPLSCHDPRFQEVIHFSSAS